MRKTLLSISVVLAGLPTMNLVAETIQLEEIVVTAQKRAQSINDVGITVNAFSGEQMKDMGVFSAEDVAQHTPGLTVNEAAATGTPNYTIRGVGFQDYSTAASSTVGLYFDEVAIPYTVMSRGVLIDMERVEVLKGPQGDLYGRNTTAGQINFVSKKPTEEFEAGISVSHGRFDTLDFEGFVSGSLTDNVNARLAYKTTQSDEGWQKSITRDDELGEKDVSAIRALFDIELNDNASLLLNLHAVRDKSENRANTAYDGRQAGLAENALPYRQLADYQLPTGANFGETPPWYSTGDSRSADWTNSYTSPITGKTFDLRPQRDNELTGASAKLEWELNEGMTLTAITGYDKFERQESNDWDGGAYNDSSNINTTDLEVFSQEVRLTYTSDELMWIAGVYYSHDEMDEEYHYFMSDSMFGQGSIPYGIPPFALSPILELQTRYEQETQSAAVFGHVEWNLTQDLRLTLGARYTQEEREWSGCTYDAGDGSLAGFLNFSFGSTLPAGHCGTIDDDPNSPNYVFGLLGSPNVNDAFHPFTDSIDTNKWMGKIGLDYAVTEDLLVYGTFSTAFKSGGFNGANSNTTQQLIPYTEEELTAFELGLKSTLLDGTLQLNAAAFWYDYEDKQEQDLAVTFVGNISGLTNVPESRINGAELELKWLPVEGLNINLGIAYLDTKVEKWEAVDPAASAWPTVVTHDVSGIELAQAPEWQYNGQIKYEWPLGETLVMEVGTDFSFQGETSGGVAIEDATDDFWVVNAQVAVGSTDGQWRAMLWSRNLTDEYYYPAAYQGGNGPYVRSAGTPNTYGVTFDYRF
ncbi:TonB-dependent receptor [Pseudomaricurvus alkylphenolicus]|uniref:TonB-dependent receptor n=1 Tax=Pseudomaricurvus alkylphenolicus TaxID=1306991 RepID=UPI0014213C72|nr:TonB-dependent receptor [Pseudomaricurvus alkylphenolicus]NIB42285.1 TonB-dependent receptor [Pseudomaricurvus alkylphenolicus]